MVVDRVVEVAYVCDYDMRACVRDGKLQGTRSEVWPPIVVPEQFSVRRDLQTVRAGNVPRRWDPACLDPRRGFIDESCVHDRVEGIELSGRTKATPRFRNQESAERAQAIR